MAPKGTKRAAPAATRAPKVQKVDSEFTAIMQIVENASTLSDSCKAMLLAAIPCSFGAYADERHEHCSTFVDMIGELVEETRSTLQSAIDAEKSVVAGAEASKRGFEDAVAGAEAKLAAAKDKRTAKQAAAAAAAQAVGEKKEALEAAKAAQSNASAAVKEHTEQKDLYEAAFNDHFKPLRDQEETPSAEQKKHCEALLPLITQLRLDDSLLTTFPSSCSTGPSARGAFDQLVMTQVEKDISDHIASLAAKLDAAAPEQAQHASAVESVERELADAEAVQKVKGQELVAADAAQEEASNAIKAAAGELKAYLQEFSAITKNRDDKVKALEDFETVNVASFTTLKDRLREVPVEKPAADAPEAQAKEVPFVAPAAQVEVGGA